MGWNEEIKKELGHCGENVFIGENVFFADPSKVFLSDRVRIDPFCLITTTLEVGSNVQICSHAVLSGGLDHTISLEDWTFIGYGSKLFCGSEDYSGEFGPVNDFWGSNKVYHGDITIKAFGGIASNVVLMPGIELPIGCCIGLNSVVMKNSWKKKVILYDEQENVELSEELPLLEWNVYVGNPLRPHKIREKDKVIELATSDSFIRRF